MPAFHSLTDCSLKVVVYTDSGGMGGAEISLGHLVAAVSPEIELTVVGVNPAVVMAIGQHRPQATQIVLPAQNLLAHWFTFKRLQPDILHFNLCTPWAGAIGLTAALPLSQTRIVRVDQLPLRTTAAIALWRTRFLSLRVDAHVAVGEASARRMEDFYALGRHSVYSIPNGVPDLGEPPPPLARPMGEMVVGSVGRLDAMKAHDILVRAIAKVAGVRLIILGEGAERANLTQLALELGVSDRVELPGWVEQPRTYLSQFDVVVLPSRSEGFPLAMVEAMLAGRPLIVTRVGSMPEAIREGDTGLLVAPNDLEGLSQALTVLRDQPGLRQQMGERARQRAIANFTVEQMTHHYENLWKKVLASPRTPRLWVPRPRD
uniref:Glycosyl transferase group 1 n=1 Tax=Cyanothece sp. (strain PCC 7425 / ATCC 29141) TaxID=395961 RepID=B8HNV3_CYAP4